MKIKINDTTYIFLLLSFLAGYFEYMYLLLLIILIHEFGHFTFGLICGINISKIIIYPFGGITIFDCDLNINIIKEFLCLLGGILFQLIFFYIMRYLYLVNIITTHTYDLIFEINVLLISFNFLPILPLDGGKLLNIFFDKVFSYRLSHILSIIVSCIFIFVFLICTHTFFSLILSIFLIKSIIYEIKNIDYKYNKFLLERYLNNYKFTKIKKVNNIKKFKRDCYHIINNKFEEKVLFKIFNVL